MNTGIVKHQWNNTETKAMELLSQGYSNVVVAGAVGVSESRISQLLSNEDFANEVAEKKFNKLRSKTDTDNKYDKIEATLLGNLESVTPLMLRPEQILRALQVVNGAKRRGASAPEQAVAQKTVVNLVMPDSIIQKFTTNIHNQVVAAGEQTLVTIQSGNLLETTKAAMEQRSANNELRTIEISTSN